MYTTTINGLKQELSQYLMNSLNTILTYEQGQYMEKLKPRHELLHYVDMQHFISLFNLDLHKIIRLACNNLPLWAGSFTLSLELGTLVLYATRRLCMSNTCGKLF